MKKNKDSNDQKNTSKSAPNDIDKEVERPSDLKKNEEEEIESMCEITA